MVDNTAEPQEATASQLQDEKVFSLLLLIDEYERIANDSFRSNYVEGFLTLSRANFNSTRKFGTDSLDRRLYDACTVVEDVDGFRVVDLLSKQRVEKKAFKLAEAKEDEKTKTPKNGEEERGDATEKIAVEKDNGAREEGGANERAETSGATLREASELKNRKSKSKPTKKTPTWTLRDPIDQFGGLVPYQLRDAQTHFASALAESVKLVNLQKRISTLIRDIEHADAGIEDTDVANM